MPDIGMINKESELQILVDKLIADQLPIDIDIETGYDGPPREKAALHPEEGHISGISLTNATSWARYVPLRHELAHNLDPEIASRILEPLLATGLTVAHNAKFECRFIRKSVEDGGLGIPLGDSTHPLLSDTIIEEFVLNEEPLVGLKALSMSRFGYDQADISSLFPDLKGPQLKRLNFSSLQLTPEVISYCCDDVIWSLALFEHNYHRVKDNFIYKMEMQILPIAVDMEETGLYYDWDMMRAATDEAMRFKDLLLQEINEDLTEATGEPVDLLPSSSQQVSAILYGKLGLSTTRVTEKGTMSTDEKAMTSLIKDHPVVRKILDWRQMNKLIGTYLAKYPEAYSYSKDGRTHPNMNLVKVKSGRFAVDDPNYQQSPNPYHFELRSGVTYDLSFRNMIKATPGWKFLGFDYSQQELRILAGESGETALLNAFKNHEDPHKQAASVLFDKPLSEVTDEERFKGKTYNFATGYGQGVKALGEQMGISQREAQKLHDKYFAAFSAIPAYVDRQIQTGKLNGEVYTRLGRKITLWEYQSSNQAVYSKGDRLCVNGAVQGGAADYTKLAMIRADKALRQSGLYATCALVMNVHDALYYEIPETASIFDYIDVLSPAVVFPIPGWPDMEAEWSVGPSWGEMKKVDVDSREEPSFEKGGPVNTGEIVMWGNYTKENDGEAFIPFPKPVSEPQEPEPTQHTVPVGVVDLGLSEGPQSLVLTLPVQPTADQGQRLVKLIGEGTNKLILQTPLGFVPFDHCALTLDMEQVVQMIVPGAQLTKDEDE